MGARGKHGAEVPLHQLAVLLRGRGPARQEFFGQDLDWPKMRVTMTVGDETLVDTIGGHPLVDPFIFMFPLVNMMREHDEIKAGMLMATHSYSGFLPVPADAGVVSTFNYFDPIEAVFGSTKWRRSPCRRRGNT